MPFTVSHVVAVLPLTTGRPGRWLVPSGLAIGAMIPDLPYFVPPHIGSDVSHAAWGPVTVDLLAGMAVFAVWHFLLAEPLTDLAPLSWRLEPSSDRRLDAQTWGRVAVSVVVGATTHVSWDTFTHPDRWGTRHFPALQDPLGVLPAYKWLQYGGGVLGLVVLTIWIAVRLRQQMRLGSERPLRASPVWSASARTRLLAPLAVVAVFAAGLLVVWLPSFLATGTLLEERVAVRMATTSIGLTLAAVLVICLAWQVARRARARAARSG